MSRARAGPGWDTFAVVVAGAAAALIGLLFVLIGAIIGGVASRRDDARC